MTVRLLANVADDQKGAVIVVDDRRAQRLIRTGYAVEVKGKKAHKESGDGGAESRSGV